MDGLKKEIREDRAGGGHPASGMTAPRNLFGCRLGRIGGPILEKSKVGLGLLLRGTPW